ncbi:MAG: sn-glycerol-1-phosphate dehydrogenase [Planctomycetes bacterium]|nr:sn-glycerol-1-phosphate dehydrogenase [Planctomycetota bacterium]
MNGRDFGLSGILRPHAGRIHVASVAIGRGALAEAASLFRAALPTGAWLVVADANTAQVAGATVARNLKAAGLDAELVVLQPQHAGASLVADEDKVAEMVERIRTWPRAVKAVIAVGAGTVTDIVKRSTFLVGIPYGAVVTAPSMNGYTSPIAAILASGVKAVHEGHVPAAVLADLDILVQAPARLIQAGFGDLLAKPISNADWLLGHELTGSFYSPDVIKLVEQGYHLLAGVASKLPSRDPEAIGRLTASLLISGYGMAVAGTSAPASGGEHLISHYLDMTHYAFGESNDLHGCQVGVGTHVAAAIYDRLMAFDMAKLDVDARVLRLLPWPQYEQDLRRRFRTLADSVIPEARDTYPTPERLRERLVGLKARWPELMGELRPCLRSAASIRDDLKAAGCPATFSEINVTSERARRAIVDAKDIRGRYTILHFCWDLGVLHEWADRVLPEAL